MHLFHGQHNRRSHSSQIQYLVSSVIRLYRKKLTVIPVQITHRGLVLAPLVQAPRLSCTCVLWIPHFHLQKETLIKYSRCLSLCSGINFPIMTEFMYSLDIFSDSSISCIAKLTAVTRFLCFSSSFSFMCRFLCPLFLCG